MFKILKSACAEICHISEVFVEYVQYFERCMCRRLSVQVAGGEVIYRLAGATGALIAGGAEYSHILAMFRVQ
jgi:hypothetical protein